MKHIRVSLSILFLFLSLAVTTISLDTSRISAVERTALVELYNATGGASWVHRERWLGPPGSECQWYGVTCGRDVGATSPAPLTVQVLYLPDNGLKGRIPVAFGGLKALRQLNFGGNAIDGTLPDSLLQAWDQGQLRVDPLSLIHDVEEVSVDLHNTALLCFGYKARITRSGGVFLESRLCHKQAQDSPTLSCELREGKTYDFDQLGRLIVRNHFFESGKSHLSTWDSGQDIAEMTITATRVGGVKVMHNLTGSISNWSLQMVVEGILSRVEWAHPPTNTVCSSK